MKANHLLFPLLIWGMTAQARSSMPATTKAANTLNFIENKGQVRDQYGQSRNDIDFRTGAAGFNIFVGSGQLHYQWATPLKKHSPDESHSVKTGMCRMDVTLIGANIHAEPISENKQDYYERYYQPSFGAQGLIAHAYQRITYKDIYPHIDWVFYVKDNIIEYDFVVHPGGRVSDIQLQYEGTTDLSLDKTGKLTAATPAGIVVENSPYSYEAEGKTVNSRFVLHGNTLGFEVDNYTGTLVIDPTLSWSTYYGGTGDDYNWNNSTYGDKRGNIYIGGYTNSTSAIATTGSFQDTLTLGTNDAFLAKFNSSGVLKWATYYGADGDDEAYGVACDTFDKVYLVGFSNSTYGMATTGAYQTSTLSGQTAFLAQFDSTGALQWGTFYGGGNEEGLGVACDRTGNVYITGYTTSTSGISTAGAYQTAKAGGQDAFLAKFSNSGTMRWATYYGGTSHEQGSAVVCDTAQNVYVTGYTKSTGGIATTGAHQTTYGGSQDAFLVKFDSSGARQWGTYCGGSAKEIGLSASCDLYGNVFISGYTFSTSGITSAGSFQPVFAAGSGSAEAFLCRFNASGVFKWGTYYGVDGDNAGNSLSCDASGHIYMTGYTNSDSNIATTGAYIDTFSFATDPEGAYLVKFDTAGNRLWGTYFGGESSDFGYSVYCGKLSRVYIAGVTQSFSGIATTGSYQTSNGGGVYDIFLASFNDCPLTQPDTLIGNDTVCRGGVYTYSIPAITGATSYTWTLPAGWTGSSITDTIHLTAGIHSDTIKVAANFDCGTSIQLKKLITVSPLPSIVPAGTSAICSGDSITLTASPGTAYQWLSAGTIISGAHSNSYVAHTGGHYTVIVTSGSGCADTSATDTLVVHPTPVPSISESGMTLSTGIFSSYQWNHNGVPIIGAVNQTYNMVVDSGNYTVTVADSNGCTGTSAIFNPAESVSTINTNGIISVYPNPTNGIVYIASEKKVTISVNAVDGRQIAVFTGPKQIDLGDYNDGIFVLRVTEDNTGQTSVLKIIKVNARQ